ncbi:MAG: urea ABC transporter permease subunit UrtC [Deltaproteobacteria bacterium]|nr:urea ABC transporter permease subunit UrtC [Deltaproteobacteria bacterium]
MTGAFDRPTRIFFVATGLFSAAVVAGSLLPEGSALSVGPLAVKVLGKYMCVATLALSVDLVWGFMGVLSLGHGAFFALGGYAFGMYLMRHIGARGVYTARIPDFMVFIGRDGLPWYWSGTDVFAYAVLLAAAAPALLALAFGWTAFRSRVSGVYFSIISQAMTYALMLAFFLNALGFGGNNGFTDFKEILGVELASRGASACLFAASAALMLAFYWACRTVAASRLGLAVRAVRDNEERARFAGYRVERVKLSVFVMSAAAAGLAGALYVPQAGIINPNSFSPLFSIEIVVCVALGGRGRLYGAVLGAFLVNWLKSLLTGLMPDAWLFVFGLLFVAATVFLPEGLAGLAERAAGSLSARRRGGNHAAEAGA